MSKRSDFPGPVRCRESLRFTAKWRATVFLAGSLRIEVVWWRGSAPHGRGRALGGAPSPHSRIMKTPAMNSGFTPNLEQPTIERATMIRPNRMLSDWRICVLVLIALWAVIYMAGFSLVALLDDADK